jgi:DAK2 domain fusion protein YloV
MLQALDAAQVRRWAVACVQSLGAHREVIDSINVFPVADSDTGSNLLHTMRAALDALLRAPAKARADAGAAVSVLARGALTGARGNSGVIVSQFLRGAADALADSDAVLGPGLRAALAAGAERAVAAMAEPVQGTMISVFQAAADAARDEESDALQDVATAAATAAAAALDRTPSQLAVLADAGVVDAGGRGVVVLFDALIAVLTGQPAALAAAQRAHAERVARPQESSLYTSRESGSDAFAYEVMYLLEQLADDQAADGLRDALVGVGDSVSVVGDGAGLWTVHVHCNDIGAAIEAGIEVGKPRQIRVARFADAPSPESSRFSKDRAVVVPSRSTEFTDLLIREGVTVCRITDDEDGALRLLETITGTAAAHVTVLPADPALIEAADEASIRAVAAGQDVVVVPCASPVQALSAVAVHDPRRRAGDDVVAMAEAAAATRRGEVVVATEAAITWIGACDAGDVLGFADGEVMLIEPGPPGVDALDRAACGVVTRMLSVGGELVTALLGADAPDELATELEDYLRRVHPEAELVVYQGGQRNAVLVLGVE